MYYVYILLDLTTGRFYTGQTNNLERRLKQHQMGKAISYTSSRGPFKLVHTEEYSTRSEAMQREKYLKSGKGREELKNILGH